MIPEKLKQPGIRFVLIEKNGKKPFEMSWQNKNIPYDNPELVKHLSNGGNYGVMGGGEKKLVVVDFDNEAVQEEALKKLPKTFTIKTGTGKLHLYYQVDDPEPKSFKGFDEEMNTLFDVQGNGKQVVGPGSIHPNGNKYEVIIDMDIQKIDYSELRAILMPFDKKTKKELKIEVNTKDVNYTENFIDDVKRRFRMDDALKYLGVDTSKNPTGCPFHSSKGGKCLGFNNETAHCFHCDGKWNVFSLIMQDKNCNFKESLEIIADIVGMRDELLESRKRYMEQQQAQAKSVYQQVKFEYLQLISGKEKRWTEASELLVNLLKKEMYFYTIKDDVKIETWVYKNGIYVPQGRSEIKERLRLILEENYTQYIAGLVLTKIDADTYIDCDEFFKKAYKNEVAVLNGILNIETRVLSEFTPHKVFFNKLPVAYNPDATCPMIDKFLSDVLSKSSDKQVYYELCGFGLLDEYKYEKAFMLHGDGRNGKGKSIELLKRLFGPENCTAVQLSALIPDDFIISELFGKRLNLAGDISSTDLKETNMFKSLTGRDFVSGKRKFLRNIHFQNYAKFVFACNELPMVYDMTKGFWDRWILLDYPYTFVSKSEYDSASDKSKLKIRDPEIIERISTPEELSGLLNKALDGLNTLKNESIFSVTEGSDEVKQRWIRRSNSFIAFCMDMIEDGWDNRISKKELRKKYSDYCKKHKIIAKSDFVIKKVLQEQYGASESHGDYNSFETRTDWWEGIKWKK